MLQTAAAPERTLALVVGVEKYELGSEWDLFGPAGAACQFADWLLKRDVKPENIFLFLSPQLRNGSGELPPVPADPRLTPRKAMENLLHDFIVEDLARRDGDLLFLYWAGHGIISGTSDNRRLFFADATPSHKRNLDLLALLRFMRSQDFKMKQQVCVIDACANRPRPAEELQTWEFPRSNEVQSGQFVLLASRPGQKARNLPAERSCLFTTAVLACLADDSNSTWPPPLDRVAQALEVRFTELRRTGLMEQSPTFFSYRNWDGQEVTIGIPDGNRPKLGLGMTCVLSTALALLVVGWLLGLGNGKPAPGPQSLVGLHLRSIAGTEQRVRASTFITNDKLELVFLLPRQSQAILLWRDAEGQVHHLEPLQRESRGQYDRMRYPEAGAVPVLGTTGTELLLVVANQQGKMLPSAQDVEAILKDSSGEQELLRSWPTLPPDVRVLLHPGGVDVEGDPRGPGKPMPTAVSWVRQRLETLRAKLRERYDFFWGEALPHL